MNTTERCKKYALEGLAILDRDGETLETCKWLAIHAGGITNKASDRMLKGNEYAGGVLDIKTTCECGLWQLLEERGSSGWSKPEETKRQAWDEIRMLLREVAGLDPIRTHARDREDWTEHWKYLFQRGDEEMQKEVIETALKMYPDFDLRLLQQQGE